MDFKDINLRNESALDYRTVEGLTREAFWNHHGPGCNEHYLLHILRDAESFIHELDFVAEVDGKIVGSIVYTKAKVVTDDGRCVGVITFGPIAVLPGHQGRGIGESLITRTKAIAKQLGHKAILIYGDPAFYSRFGFAAAETYQIGTPDGMYAAALQALELSQGALSGSAGRFVEDAIFEIDEAAAERFDKGFPHREKCVGLPTQERFRQLAGMRVPRR